MPKAAGSKAKGRSTLCRALIGNTTRTQRLRIQAQLDDRDYAAGIKVSDKELAEVVLERDEFHGEWNYRVKPRDPGG